MCYMCTKDDIFAVYQPTSKQRLRERASLLKKIIIEAENHAICIIGDDLLQTLKKEQYELARQL